MLARSLVTVGRIPAYSQRQEACVHSLPQRDPAGWRRALPMDPRLAAFTLFGMMNWIYNWYHPERDVPVTELADNMSQLFGAAIIFLRRGSSPVRLRRMCVRRFGEREHDFINFINFINFANFKLDGTTSYVRI